MLKAKTKNDVILSEIYVCNSESTINGVKLKIELINFFLIISLKTLFKILPHL